MNAAKFLQAYAQGTRDFRRAELRGATLPDANLAGANLEGADLRRANLEGAELPSADLLRVARRSEVAASILTRAGAADGPQLIKLQRPRSSYTRVRAICAGLAPVFRRRCK